MTTRIATGVSPGHRSVARERGSDSRSAQRGLARHIALWTLQIAMAGMFLFAGGLKLTGAPEMVAVFDAVGLGQWFRYLTGTIEIAAAVALLIPGLAIWGALLLVPTMVGAIATHLFIVGGSPLAAAVLLLGSLVLGWVRRDEFTRALSRLR
jgi:putative oxidoreductase